MPYTPEVLLRASVATHSNAHHVGAHARNLTRGQLDIIRASDGLVGLNFASAFLRSDGRMITDAPSEQMILSS